MIRDSTDDDSFLRQLPDLHDYLHMPMPSGRTSHAQIYLKPMLPLLIHKNTPGENN